MSKFNCKVKGLIIGYAFPTEKDQMFFSIRFISEKIGGEEKEFKKPITEDQYKIYNKTLDENYGKIH